MLKQLKLIEIYLLYRFGIGINDFSTVCTNSKTLQDVKITCNLLKILGISIHDVVRNLAQRGTGLCRLRIQTVYLDETRKC